MTSRAGVRLAALLVPAALLLPTAALAQTASYDDGAGDAKALNFAAEFAEGQTPFLPAPAETSIDVTSTTINHAKKRVTLTVAFRDLTATDEHSLDISIFTPDGRWSVLAGMVDGHGLASLYPHRITDPLDGTLRPCRAVRARYDLAVDTVTVSFPSACIMKPDWIQVGIVANRLSVTPIGDGSVNLAGFVDDAFRPSMSMRSVGRSPKIRRG